MELNPKGHEVLVEVLEERLSFEQDKDKAKTIKDIIALAEWDQKVFKGKIKHG